MPRGASVLDTQPEASSEGDSCCYGATAQVLEWARCGEQQHVDMIIQSSMFLGSILVRKEIPLTT